MFRSQPRKASAKAKAVDAKVMAAELFIVALTFAVVLYYAI